MVAFAKKGSEPGGEGEVMVVVPTGTRCFTALRRGRDELGVDVVGSVFGEEVYETLDLMVVWGNDLFMATNWVNKTRRSMANAGRPVLVRRCAEK
jgi:hypothetical protein